ncbi:MAG: FRG domain-containing protein [Planctomycetia bacterium]|nr:FRG domain-containing protein [Planctomycetia bacterium]MCC7314624.1 FRG domain-containing protein [Planctomycetota bacterium]
MDSAAIIERGEIHSCNDLLNFVEILQDVSSSLMWFRGEQSAFEKLTPQVFREPNWANHEASMSNDFVLRAPSRHSHTPDLNEHIRWLSLMRHYGLPTRLLDWTESPLIGAYFCVTISKTKEHEEKEGYIWVLLPGRLNDATCGIKGMLTAGHPKVSEIARHAFDRASGSTTNADNVLAFAPEEFDRRIIAQKSMFTIHRSGECLTKIAEYGSVEQVNCSASLARIVVPAKAKKQLRSELRVLGIRESDVFPDLEHLANEISDAEFIRRRFHDLGYVGY